MWFITRKVETDQTTSVEAHPQFTLGLSSIVSLFFIILRVLNSLSLSNRFSSCFYSGCWLFEVIMFSIVSFIYLFLLVICLTEFPSE